MNATTPLSATSCSGFVTPAQSWITWQLRWIVFQVGVLASLLAVLIVLRLNETSLLWSTRLGFNMLCQTAIILCIGFVISLVVCGIMDRNFPNWHESKPVWGWVTAGLLLGVQFIWLFLPAVFVLINGPAAIQIVESLAI